MIGGIGLLIGVILYYRRFLVEYFIGRGLKIQGLFLGGEHAHNRHVRISVCVNQ